MSRQFTEANVTSWVNSHNDEPMFKIYCDVQDLIDAPLDWQKRGLQQTASGYGSKLTSRYKIHFEGKEYRLYVTIYGNAGSTWFRVRGRKIFVD